MLAVYLVNLIFYDRLHRSTALKVEASDLLITCFLPDLKIDEFSM